MENRNYIKELEESESIKLPNFLDGHAAAMDAVFEIALGSGTDLYSFPKFVELQDFVLKRLKDA